MNKSLLGLGLCVAGAARAQLFHLGIDISDPANVVFSATSLPSTQDDFGKRAFDGITLGLFFNPALPTQVGGVLAGNLRAWSMPIVYDTWASDDVTPGLVTDLSIYTTGPGFNFPETFDTHFQALAGSASIDLSAYLANFQPEGTSGPIFAGSSGNLGSPMGTWQITAVPELPVAAHLALYGAGFVGLAVYRRSRKA